jgi:uncharacterized protein YjiS (DUF1127 family)
MSFSNNAWHVSPSQQPVLAAAGKWLLRLRAGFESIKTAWLIRHRRQRDAQILRAFSDREFWDVGLSRSDISAIANGTYRRD